VASNPGQVIGYVPVLAVHDVPGQIAEKAFLHAGAPFLLTYANAPTEPSKRLAIQRESSDLLKDTLSVD
jgi:hypothetical protein